MRIYILRRYNFRLINKDKIIKVKLNSKSKALIGGLKFAKYAFSSFVDSKVKFIIKKRWYRW